MLSHRDQTILDAVLVGRYAPMRWARVRCGRVELQVSEDVLTLDGVRVGVSPPLAQALADALGCVLPTPRIADAIYEQAAVRLAPHPQEVTAPDGERRHTRAIDAELRGRAGLADTLGKHWVLCRAVLTAEGRRAANYGWHLASPGWGSPSASTGRPGCSPAWVIQGVPTGGASMAHTYQHHDYSQTFRAVRRACLYDGAPADLAEVLVDPARAGEVSHEGALAAARLPGCTPLVERADEPATAPTEPPPSTLPTGAAAPAPEPVRPGAQAADGGAPTEAHVGQPGALWTPARHYTLVSAPRRVLWVVLHSTETHSRPGAARALGRAWSSPSSPQVSAHYVVDAAETVQCVDEVDVAWAAPGANAAGVQIEMVGRTVAYPGPWLGPEPATVWDRPGWGLDVLRRSAALARGICDRHGLPLERRTAAELVAGAPGITTHATVTAAARLARQGGQKVAPWWRADVGWVGGDHCDPGGPGDRAWPWERFLAEVRGAA